MEGLFVIVLIAIALFAAIGALSGKGKPASGGSRHRGRPAVHPPVPEPYAGGPLPERLGLAERVPLGEMAGKLERAFDAEYAARLKRRVLERYPRMTEAEYEWKLFELKRFLLMNAVLKQVPMYSPEVDDIWHEMLMFTREYQRFCEAWLGRVVHHSPHADSSPMPGERAWFDWVYGQLFVPTPYSSRIWRGFFRHPLDEPRLRELETGTPERLAETLFNKSAAESEPEVAETIRLLIAEAKGQIARAREAAGDPERRIELAGGADRSTLPASSSPVSHAPHFGEVNYGLLAGSMMMFSVLAPDRFEEQMQSVLSEEEKKAPSSSSCGGAGCAAYHDFDGSSDGYGSDGGGANDAESDSGGGASCSSSSCSSGCGGGGD